VIGINSMIAGGMAVAVPSNTAARVVAGEMPGQGFIGIFAQPVPLPPAWASGPSPDQPVPSPHEPEAPTPTADPALAELDAHARHARRSGLFAADVLEQLNTNGKQN
jgi:hypothetical protein